jgi:hypothetical protein
LPTEYRGLVKLMFNNVLYDCKHFSELIKFK